MGGIYSSYESNSYGQEGLGLYALNLSIFLPFPHPIQPTTSYTFNSKNTITIIMQANEDDFGLTSRRVQYVNEYSPAAAREVLGRKK